MAWGNMGIPMLVVAWPAYWLALLPVIAFEGHLGSQVLNLGRAEAMKTAAVANLWSTFLGIPVVWVGLFALEMIIGVGLSGTNVRGVAEWVLFPFMTPWLAPTENIWLVYAAFVILAVPFCVASIWIETKVALRRHPNHEAEHLRKWIRHANIWSYIVIAALAIGFPLFGE